MQLIEKNGVLLRADSELLNDEGQAIEIKGLRDAHCHLVWLGMKHYQLDLQGSKSQKDCIERALDFGQNRGGWILGRGWNEENWDDRNFDRHLLDKYFPNIPVYFIRIDGHAAWCNSKALEIAKISRNSKNPDGGEILKDSWGNPSGILIDMALEMINLVVPNPSDVEIEQYILKAIELCLGVGLTEVHDMDVHIGWLPVFEKLAKEKRLGIDIKSYIRAFDEKYLEQNIHPNRINNWYLAGLKFYADGALGSRGAALLEDYSDKKGHKGIVLMGQDELLKKAIAGLNHGFEIATHAIGDRANRMVLDVYQAIRKDKFTGKLRIEHAQIVHPNDLNRFAENNIEVTIQPMFAISDKNMAAQRLGERLRYSYPWKSLLETGANVFGSSDSPIESHDPLSGINALVNSGVPWQEGEHLSWEDAVSLYKPDA